MGTPCFKRRLKQGFVFVKRKIAQPSRPGATKKTAWARAQTGKQNCKNKASRPFQRP
jgi:hypothetical protein